MNTLFIFRYDQFGIGGIQTWIYQAVRQLLKEKVHVLLVTKKKNQIYEGFSVVFSDPRVSIIDYKEEPKWRYSDYGVIKYYSFTLEGFVKACQFKRQNETSKIDLFYCVPNTKGYDYYYDEPFNGLAKKYINKRLSTIFDKMNKANQIRYFSRGHIETMITLYNYCEIAERSYLYIPRVDIKQPFDEQQRREIWKRKEFRIIAVSRFDFPHKAYIIGLINAYEEIHRKYPNVTLLVVGSGHSRGEIENRISQLEEDVKKGITIYGEANYDDLPSLYKEANLNISLAGCCVLGAKNGVLSIPARHFSYNCEVYGFLPESKSMITSAEPGQSVNQYIEEAINMTENEYVQKCFAGYQVFDNITPQASLFDSNLTDYVLPNKDIRFVLIVHSLILRYVPFKQRIHRAIQGELFSMIKKKIRKKQVV